jgi:hypothetical protein
MRYVRIRSGDGSGPIGLDLGYTDEQGPCLIKQVHVIGFDVGVSTRYVVDSVTLEFVTVEGQRKVGFSNRGQCVSMRRFTSRNSVTAIENEGGASLLCLIEADIEGRGGASGLPAIENTGSLLARDLKVSGYALAVKNGSGTKTDAPAGSVTEFCSHEVLELFSSPPRTMRLPVKETPEPKEVPLDEWTGPHLFGGDPDDKEDDTEAVQKAVDSGKRVLYFPYGRNWLVNGTVLVRGKIERVTAFEGSVKGNGTFKVVEGDSPVVVFDRMGQTYKKVAFENASSRTMVLSGILTWGPVRLTGPGECFLEDFCGQVHVKGQRLWARQWNNEKKTTKIRNDGGTVWILGLKTEQAGTLIETVNGGKTELLGGFCYAQGAEKTTPMFVLRDSAGCFTIGEATFNRRPFHTVVEETRGGETRTLKKGEAPGRCNGSMIPLFVGYRAEDVPRPPEKAAAPLRKAQAAAKKPEPGNPERAAKGRLRTARMYLDAGVRDLAWKALKDIVERYPDTKAAAEAEKLLAGIAR